MENLNPEQTTPEQSTPAPARRWGITPRRIIVWALVLLGAYIIYWAASLFLSPDRHIKQIYLVPRDAAVIIQSSEPVRDWKKFSTSEPWQTLKTSETFAEITANADMMDSIIHSNKVLLSLVGRRDMMISLHKTKPGDWDFLAIVDMRRMSKMNTLKEQLEKVLKLSGYTVTQRTYNSVNIIEMRDPETRDILYMAFVDNHLVASYTSALVHASIDERGNPAIGLEESFINAEGLVEGKGLCRVYINYKHLSDFLGIYLGGRNEYVDMFCNGMDYAGLYCNVGKDGIDARGYTLPKEQANPYMAAMMNSGTHKMKAHAILSARTAFYVNIGIGKPADFVRELETAMEQDGQQAYKTYKASLKKIENYFGISLYDNFLSWMSGEFAVTQSEPGLLGREPELILAIRATNIKDARRSMELLESRIRHRTPLKMKAVQYKNYTISYVELNGFFRLFFGNLFDSFEKPYYTYIDDYVVFSNNSASILSFIEDYEQKNLLKNDDKFTAALSDAKSSSSIFAYIDTQKYYPLLQKMVTPSVRTDLAKNREILYSFPVWMLQVVGHPTQPSMHYSMRYEKYVEPEPEEVVEAVDEEPEDAQQSEREVISELKRFHLEKFEGNILRDFYPDGSLKSETETRSGVRHGRHREYYPNGGMKARGKYAHNKPKGVWKFYTDEGKLERKEKY